MIKSKQLAKSQHHFTVAHCCSKWTTYYSTSAIHSFSNAHDINDADSEQSSEKLQK